MPDFITERTLRASSAIASGVGVGLGRKADQESRALSS